MNKKIKDEVNFFMDKYGQPYSSPKLLKLPTTLVLSGGAIKGIYLLGALHGLYNGLYNDVYCNVFKRLIGTSSGGIICFLLSIGYSPFEIYKSLLKSDNLLTVDYTGINAVFSRGSEAGDQKVINGRGGIFSSKHIFLHVQKLMYKKKINRNLTFKEHNDITGTMLVITAFNVTQKKETLFSMLTFPDVPIIEALQLSSGIPIVFRPLSFNDDMFVDGGVWDNFPVKVGLDLCENSLLAVTTIFSFYKKNLCQWYNNEKLIMIMVEDNDDWVPTLVSTDEDKFYMFLAGYRKGKKTQKNYKKKRRNTI